MGTVVQLRRRQTPERVDACSDCRHKQPGPGGSTASFWKCGALAADCSVVRQQLRGTPCPHFAAKPPALWQRIWRYIAAREGLD